MRTTQRLTTLSLHFVCAPFRHRATCALLFWTLCGALTACEPKAPPSLPASGRAPYDRTTLHVDALSRDAAVRQRILYMPFGEAAARLGSLKFDGKSTFAFSRNGIDYEEADTYTLAQDSRGDSHVLLESPLNGLEMYLFGEVVLVRYDKGLLRQKTRQDGDPDPLFDAGFLGLAQALEVFRRAQFDAPTPEHVDGRAATRFRIVLGPADQDAGRTAKPTKTVRRPYEPQYPMNAPERWREQARPLDLHGTMDVDNDTGVILRSELEGRVEVADRDVHPTELTLRYSASLSEIGHVAPLKQPKSIAEYRRVPRNHDPLDFFADQLPVDPNAVKQR